jgi:hypothetical protein
MFVALGFILYNCLFKECRRSVRFNVDLPRNSRIEPAVWQSVIINGVEILTKPPINISYRSLNGLNFETLIVTHVHTDGIERNMIFADSMGIRFGSIANLFVDVQNVTVKSKVTIIYDPETTLLVD